MSNSPALATPAMSLLQNLAAAIKANVGLLQEQLANDGASNETLFLNDARASFLDDPAYLPPVAAFNTIEKLRVDLRALESAITPTRYKLADVAMLTVKTSALEVASDLGVADHIDAAGGSVALDALARGLSVNENKLS